MYRIILIDDEPLILAGIASLIRWEDQDCCIVGKATNGHAAIDLILESRPDIVITDIRMPVMNGLELIEACKAKNCEFAFIFLTNLEVPPIILSNWISSLILSSRRLIRQKRNVPVWKAITTRNYIPFC